MAQTVNVNFKLDADVKKSMEQACSDMGLSMSAAFTIFAKRSAEKDASLLRCLLIRFTVQKILPNSKDVLQMSKTAQAL